MWATGATNGNGMENGSENDNNMFQANNRDIFNSKR